MDERKIKQYFKQQVHVIMQRSVSEPDGFHAYFKDRDPRDEEILGLLAVTSMVNGEFLRREAFPSPLEALAALSPAARSVICQQFRRELKTCLRNLRSPRRRVARPQVTAPRFQSLPHQA